MHKKNDESPLGRPALAAALAILCAFLWGSAFPAVKIGYEFFSVGADDTAAKLQFAGIRFALAGALVLVFRYLSRLRIFSRSARPTPTLHVSAGRRAVPLNLLLVSSLGLAQTAIQYFFFYIGLSYTTGAKGSIINSTTVFFSALFAHFIYQNDKLGVRKALGIFLGFAGVILVNYKYGTGFSFTLQGEGFILISAIILSITAVYSKFITTRVEPRLAAGGQLFSGGLVLIAAGKAMGATFPPISPGAWLILTYLALLSAVAFTLWAALLKYNKVSFITAFTFLIPVVGTVLSSIFLGESIKQLQYLLAIPAVACGIFLVNGNPGKRIRKTA
jgi:drug/metabolite transporter (DMT)-like permease